MVVFGFFETNLIIEFGIIYLRSFYKRWRNLQIYVWLYNILYSLIFYIVFWIELNIILNCKIYAMKYFNVSNNNHIESTWYYNNHIKKRHEEFY